MNRSSPGKRYIQQLEHSFTRRITLMLILGIIFLLASLYTPTVTIPNLLLSFMGAAGTTLIAAAVIGFILSDEDYIKLLRDHVIEVLFNPENYRDNESLMKRWLAITAHLLKGVLPSSYKSAALEIQKQFLTNEKDFHYEDVAVTLDIKVSPDGLTAEVHQVTALKLMISPNCAKPLLDQYVKTQEGGEVELVSLDIAGKPIDINAHFQDLEGNPNIKVLKYPISDSEIITNGAGERCATYRRIYKFKQNMANEPFIATNIQRFTKGLVVEAKVNVGYKLYFKRFGIKGQEDHTGISVAQGYTRWVLAQTGDLLLPGESYILMILKV